MELAPKSRSRADAAGLVPDERSGGIAHRCDGVETVAVVLLREYGPDSIRHSETALRAYDRRIAPRIGGDLAVFATAGELTALIYRLLRRGQPVCGGRRRGIRTPVATAARQKVWPLKPKNLATNDFRERPTLHHEGRKSQAGTASGGPRLNRVRPREASQAKSTGCGGVTGPETLRKLMERSSLRSPDSRQICVSKRRVEFGLRHRHEEHERGRSHQSGAGAQSEHHGCGAVIRASCR
jgi:hypothetical protein